MIFSFQSGRADAYADSNACMHPGELPSLRRSFACAPPEGAEPHGRLTLDPDGTTLYGMTREGGSMGLASYSKSTRAEIITLSCTTLWVDMTTARRAITVTLFSRITISTV